MTTFDRGQTRGSVKQRETGARRSDLVKRINDYLASRSGIHNEFSFNKIKIFPVAVELA